jgi:two-component system NtrC family sensor kinase
MRSAKLASIGELATGFAHEINNPLAIIAADQTNIGDLAADFDGTSESVKEILESVARCQRQIQRCKSITTKMLRFGRNTELELRPTEIGRHLVEITKLLRRRASEGNVELALQVDEDLPLVLVNEVELEQVVVNLVNNSLYALPRGGRVTIAARRGGEDVIVEVDDDGTGISLEHLDRVFEPFYTTKPTGKGTGLGLAVCYGIVQSWGGRMEVKSSRGKGTTMRFRIPVSGETVANQSTEVNHAYQTTEGKPASR